MGTLRTTDYGFRIGTLQIGGPDDLVQAGPTSEWFHLYVPKIDPPTDFNVCVERSDGTDYYRADEFDYSEDRGDSWGTCNKCNAKTSVNDTITNTTNKSASIFSEIPYVGPQLGILDYEIKVQDASNGFNLSVWNFGESNASNSTLYVEIDDPSNNYTVLDKFFLEPNSSTDLFINLSVFNGLHNISVFLTYNDTETNSSFERIINATLAVGIATETINISTEEKIGNQSAQSITDGVAYLISNQNPDGSWGDNGFDILTTSEVLNTLIIAGANQTVINNGLSYLDNLLNESLNSSFNDTFLLSKTLLSFINSNQTTSNVEAAKRIVLNSKNDNNGWGYTPEFRSDPFTTLLVGKIKGNDTWLLDALRNTSWEAFQKDSVFVTAVIAKSIPENRINYDIIIYLESQQNLSIVEESVVLSALLRKGQTDYTSQLASDIEANQTVNGSFGSLIETAHAISGLIDYYSTTHIAISDCTTIASPGTYVLNRNIINSSMNVCVDITSSNVSFDGAGYSIDGTDMFGTSGVRVYSPMTTPTNVIIKNLGISDWSGGIYFAAENGSIINTKASSNSYGIYISSSRNNFLFDNTAFSNTYHGIYLSSSYNNTLNNNTATSNNNGIYLSSSSNNILADNTASHNQNYGIYLAEGRNVTIENNTVTYNGNDAISIINPPNVIKGDISQPAFEWHSCNLTNADDYVQSDDGSSTYTLPWNFIYFGRNITAIDFNTNGLIELLENGESCYECGDYGTHYDKDHIGNMDAIFASNDDLQTDDTSDSYVAVCNFTDKIVVEWNGSTYDDYDTSSYNTNFQVVLYQNGSIAWNFKTMEFSVYDADMFTGIYALEENAEGEVGYAIDTQSSYLFDPSLATVKGSPIAIINNNASYNGNSGIYIQNALDLEANANILTNNNYGVYLVSSRNNTIYNNYFNNTNNTFFVSSYNGNWNTTKTNGTNIIDGPYLGGNFWANPNGTGFSETCADANGDGICNSPYTLNANNTDYLPLTLYNTPAGMNVEVEFVDEDINITFANVTAGGQTSVNVSTTGPSPSSGFNLTGNYYDVTTTANYTGNITVCINYNESQVGNESSLKLFHYENSSWADVTTSLDISANSICGDVTSLFPFAVMETIDITPPFVCEKKTDYEMGVSCSGTFYIDMLADIDVYVESNFGRGTGNPFKHVKIREDLINASGNIVLHSPCQITLKDNVVLTSDNICLDGRKGVLDDNGYTVNADNVAVLSELDNAGFGQGSFINVSNSLFIEALKTAKIGIGSTLNAHAADISIISTGNQSSSHAIIKSGGTITANNLWIQAQKTAKIGENNNVNLTGNLTILSTGDFTSSDGLIKAGSTVSADNINVSASRTAKFGDHTHITAFNNVTLTSTGSATGSEALMTSGASLNASGSFTMTSGNKAKLGLNVNVDVAENFHMEAATPDKCTIKSSATYTAASISGNCLA